MMRIVNEIISEMLGLLFIFLYVIVLGYYITCIIFDSVFNKVNNQHHKRDYICEDDEWHDKKIKTE